MSWRRLGMVLTVSVVSLGAGLGVLRYLGAREVPPGVLNPAATFYTRHHESGYGGIDRWASYGMEARTLVELLARDGYVCEPPPAIGEPLKSVHILSCVKQMSWPLARTLLIKASIDHDQRGRLVAAQASSTTRSETWLGQAVQDLLRGAGLIEPPQLQVRGFEIDSVDKLAQYVLDALAPVGWPEVCNGQASVPQCSYFIETRRAAGFPALPQAAASTRDALSLSSAMESLRLLPVEQRGADGQPADALLVRFDGEHMWMDFTGRDLTGRRLAVSIALDPEGGAPVQLVAQLGAQDGPVRLAGKRPLADRGAMRFVPLAGARRESNAGATYLVPLAGAQDRRLALWIHMPDRANPHPHIFQAWAKVLPMIEPALLPRIIRVAVDSVAKAQAPEEILGLYPRLRIIERRADLLRRARVQDWMPDAQGDAFIRQAFRDDPVMRAAWLLAHCEFKQRPPENRVWARPTVIDAGCWRQRASDDAQVLDLLRREVATLESTYGDLEQSHPLRLRLRRLNSILSPDPVGLQEPTLSPDRVQTPENDAPAKEKDE